MLSTMMHTPMTVKMIFEHGSKLFPHSKICSFDGEKIVYENFFETTDKVGQLANALSELGVDAGDRDVARLRPRGHLLHAGDIPACELCTHTGMRMRMRAESAWEQ